MMSRKTNRFLPLALLLLGLCPVALTPGCGGGGGSTPPAPVAPATTGRAQFTIVWPARETTRVVPSAANLIQILLKRGDTLVAERTVARPETGQSTVTFENLPVDTFTVLAAAYPNADGTPAAEVLGRGTAQSFGTAVATVRPGETTVFTLTMASTIDRLLPFGTRSVSKNRSSSLNNAIIALTADGQVVMTRPEQFVWSGSSEFFTVDPTGIITGIALGTGTVTVQDRESGKSTSVPVSVIEPPPAPPGDPLPNPIAVRFDPDTVKVSVRNSLQLTPIVTGYGAGAVTWKVEEEGDASVVGTVDANGLYSAPITSGTFHVRATSVDDVSKFARVTIQVVSGSAGGTIQ